MTVQVSRHYADYIDAGNTLGDHQFTLHLFTNDTLSFTPDIDTILTDLDELTTTGTGYASVTLTGAWNFTEDPGTGLNPVYVYDHGTPDYVEWVFDSGGVGAGTVYGTYAVYGGELMFTDTFAEGFIIGDSGEDFVRVTPRIEYGS